MSTNVVVEGLPGDADFSKLVYTFKREFKRIQIKKFWIRDLSAYGSNFSQMTVEFTNNAEARKARNFLDNLPFVYANMEYPLEAFMAEDSVHFEKGGQRSRGRKPPKRERPRSRSPGYRQEASKLDMEIELLRKQRLVIEEERRLLMEQKKLEMIREYGPNAMREFDDFDGHEPPRKRRHPEPVQAKRPRKRTPPLQHKPKPTNKRPKGLPVFFQPCKKLISEMKPFIEKDTTIEEAGILIKLIRAAIRKNLAIALEGKDYMPTGEIIKLYRERNPMDKDEVFVAKILSNIRASYLTTEVKIEKKEKEIKKEKVTEIETDNKKDEENVTEIKTNDSNDKEDSVNQADNTKDKESVGEGDNVATVANDEVWQETTTNGDNVTDAAPDVNVQVTAEPNVSQDTVNISKDVSQELEDVSAENLSNDVAVVGNNSAALNTTLVLNETETATDLQEDELLQDTTDWVEEQ